MEADRTIFEGFEGFEGSPFTFGENKCCSKDRTEFDGALLLKRFQNSPDLICDDIEEEVDLIEAYVSWDDVDELEERVSDEYEEFLCLAMAEVGERLTRQ